MSTSKNDFEARLARLSNNNPEMAQRAPEPARARQQQAPRPKTGGMTAGKLVLAGFVLSLPIFGYAAYMVHTAMTLPTVAVAQAAPANAAATPSAPQD